MDAMRKRLDYATLSLLDCFRFESDVRRDPSLRAFRQPVSHHAAYAERSIWLVDAQHQPAAVRHSV